MISVAEARAFINQFCNQLLPINFPLQKAVGLVLAETVYSGIDLPAFPQSSMDGYAFSFDDWKQGHPLKIKGEAAAGNQVSISISKGQAARIFTGAVVPGGADTVVMQEKVKTNGSGELLIEDPKLEMGSNVRSQGSEIKAGATALAAGTHLTPAAIGFLAGLGCVNVKVYPPPSITIIVTGNELVQPGQPLPHGSVYESNSYSLRAALEQQHIHQISILYAEDKPEAVNQALESALAGSEVVLLTGGISVGDYDFVLQAANHCGVTKRFHTIKQRPGKPLYFGTKDNKLVFGLPGNPASVLTCYYQYVLPALGILMKNPLAIIPMKVPVASAYNKPAGLTHFLKGVYDGRQVHISGAQESYRLSSFAGANCLVEIKEEATGCVTGEAVDIYLLPV